MLAAKWWQLESLSLQIQLNNEQLLVEDRFMILFLFFVIKASSIMERKEVPMFTALFTLITTIMIWIFVAVGLICIGIGMIMALFKFLFR